MQKETGQGGYAHAVHPARGISAPYETVASGASGAGVPIAGRPMLPVDPARAEEGAWQSPLRLREATLTFRLHNAASLASLRLH